MRLPRFASVVWSNIRGPSALKRAADGGKEGGVRCPAGSHAEVRSNMATSLQQARPRVVPRLRKLKFPATGHRCCWTCQAANSVRTNDSGSNLTPLRGIVKLMSGTKMGDAAHPK
jgi:hypothetical protein